MKDWKVGEVIGLISATAFALTVVYLYGYQMASHHSLFEYLSVNDYFRLAVAWLVPVALGWLTGVLIEAALRRSEHGMSEHEIEEAMAKGHHARFWRAYRKWGLGVPFVIAPVAVVVNTALLLFAHLPKLWYYENLTLAGPIVWFAAVKWYEREKRLVTDWSNARRAWVWFFPAALIFSFFRGASTAERAKAPFQNADATRVFVLGRPEPAVGRVLFRLDDYILLRTNTGAELEAIPKAQVSLIVVGTEK